MGSILISGDNSLVQNCRTQAKNLFAVQHDFRYGIERQNIAVIGYKVRADTVSPVSVCGW